MLRTLQLCLLFLLLCLSGRISAQCIDSTAIHVGFSCDPHYDPVCGCDGHTYRNDCYAMNSGVRTWQTGSCDMIDFDFNPNPVQNDGEVILDAIVRNPGNVDIQIFDHYGRMFYTSSIYVLDRYRFYLDFRAYQYGLYIIVLKNADGYKTKKVVKPDY